MRSHRTTTIAISIVAVVAILLALLNLQGSPAAAADPRPVTAPSTPTTVAPPAAAPVATAAVGTDDSETPVPERIEPDRPVRVLVVGDSITQAAQVPITSAIERRNAQVQILSWGGTAPCDWIESVATKVADFDPDIVLIEFAGNDLTACIADTPRGSAGYLERYAAAAEAITAAAGAQGARVRWTEVPVMADVEYNAVTVELNRIYRQLSDDGQLTPLRAALKVDGGFGYTDRCRGALECGEAPAFTSVPIRSDDGLHLAAAGSVRMGSLYGQVVGSLIG